MHQESPMYKLYKNTQAKIKLEYSIRLKKSSQKSLRKTVKSYEHRVI